MNGLTWLCFEKELILKHEKNETNFVNFEK